MKKRLTTIERQLAQEIATVLNDITYPYQQRTLRNVDPTLLSRAGAKGLALYDEVERDAHARALLTKRKMMVAGAKWDLLPASDSRRDQKAADFVRGVLQKMRFARVRYNFLDAVLKGFAVGEAMWAIEGDYFVITEVRARDQRRFTFGIDHQPRLLTPGDTSEGQAVPHRKMICHVFDARNENPYGTAMGSVLWFLVKFKKEVEKHWLSGSERFGFPSVLATVPANYTEEQQAKVLAAAEQVYSESAAVVPEGVEVKLLESHRANDTSIHKELLALLNEEMSKAVLLQSATMSLGRTGSYAASETFAGFEKALAQFDADMLDETLTNTLVKWLVEVNFPGAGVPRLVSEMTDEAELSERAKRDGLIMGLGFKPSLEYVQKTYGSHWEDAPQGSEQFKLPPAVAGNFNGGAPGAAGQA